MTDYDGPLTYDSRTSCEVRGLKYTVVRRGVGTPSRTSCEVRGLKCQKRGFRLLVVLSHLMRGAWIEIAAYNQKPYDVDRRTSCEVRGLKCL